MSVSSSKVVVVFFYVKKKKNTLKVFFFSSDKLSGVLQTSCARLVRVLIVVALCDVGL